jgi:hypothetical protein
MGCRSIPCGRDWSRGRWSSTRAHLRGKDNGLTALAPVEGRFPRFADLLASEPEVDLFGRLRAAESIGRPLGDDAFLAGSAQSSRRDFARARARIRAAVRGIHSRDLPWISLQLEKDTCGSDCSSVTRGSGFAKPAYFFFL